MGPSPRPGGTLIRLFQAEEVGLEIDTALAIAGSAGVVDGPAHLMFVGERYLSRQTAELGGGTTEQMARNVVGERILGFPREHAADRGVPVQPGQAQPNLTAALELSRKTWGYADVPCGLAATTDQGGWADSLIGMVGEVAGI